MARLDISIATVVDSVKGHRVASRHTEARVLFMVVERFKQGDFRAVGARFRARGRLMPPGVEYRASWMEPGGARCFQINEATSREALEAWMRNWEDLVDFEAVEIMESADFWAHVPPLAD